MIDAIKTGGRNGIKVLLSLLKIIIPIYCLVVAIKYTPLMGMIESSLAPLMGIFGLPGEGIVPLVAGFFTDEYGVVAAIEGISPMSTAQITTVAMMSAACHSIPVESVIAKKIGLNPAFFIVFRILLAIAVGIFVGWIGGLILS